MLRWELVPFALSALLTALCARYVWARRRQPGARSYAGILAAETVWSVGYTAELLSRSLSGKVLWDDVQLAAMVWLMAMLPLFVWDYGERIPKRAQLIMAGYMVVPTLALAWVLSDPIHGRARDTAHIVAAPPFGALLYDFSGPEIALVAQFYLATLFVTAALTRMAARQHKMHGAHLLLILFGLLLPTVVNTLGLLGFRLMGQRDMSPACYGIAALAVSWAMFRRHFWELVPIARDVVFEQLPDPVLVLDPHDRVVDLNPGAQQLLRAHRSSLGMPLSALFGGDRAARLSGVPADDVAELTLGERTFEARSEPLAIRGRVRGRVVLLRDVSAHKRAERALQRAHDALEQRVEARTHELHAANEAMKLEIVERTRAEAASRESERERAALQDELHHAQKLDSIGRLAGGIAHDFNNLLTVILGQIELAMLAAQRGQDPQHSLEQALAAGDSAANLTRQLLTFARKQPSQPRVLSLNEVVEQTHSMLVRLIGEDIQLKLSLQTDLRRICVDRSQIEQVLLNLTVNARDAMPAGGELHILTENVRVEPSRAQSLPRSASATTSPRECVRLRVADTGVGMSPDVLEHIFEPFFTTKGASGGTGIGLSTVYGLVQQADGFIEVESQPGEGTTLDVYFPSTEALPEHVSPVSREIPHGTERVALVEDQRPVRELVSKQLRRLGYSVVTFSKAEDALKAFTTPEPEFDLLVTDVVLAGMNGPTLVRRLREVRHDLKVLYVSGYTNGEINARGLADDSEPLLPKPFSMKQLAQAVRGVLERAS